MNDFHLALLIGVCIGFVLGVGLVLHIVFFIRLQKKCGQVEHSSQRAVTVPVRVNWVDSCATLSDSGVSLESPRTSEWSNMILWLGGLRRKNVVTAWGIPKYSYKDIQKATSNFTTIIGHGALGPVYKAQMPTGETVAVKVLVTNSKHGEKEFLTEVLLLGRLHHKNLVSLVGYAAEGGQHMLLYTYISNSNLASYLHDLGENHEPLDWDVRLRIALDVARGLEYLHYGAAPPVLHRDIKSSNILLDQFMRAKVTDFGLPRPEIIRSHLSNARGTIEYLDPEYMSTITFTKKSDVYSFGILLFELITGRNPQQGLLDCVKLAAMEAEGKVGWEEFVDSRLNGKYDLDKLHDIAALAFKCVNDASKNRPSIRVIVQALSQLCEQKHEYHGKTSPPVAEEVSIQVEGIETQSFSLKECSNELCRLYSR